MPPKTGKNQKSDNMKNIRYQKKKVEVVIIDEVVAILNNCTNITTIYYAFTIV